MSLAARGAVWIGMYLLLALAPLGIALAGRPPGERPFLVDFSVALGFVGLAVMGMQFALVARFRTVAAPFGQDALVLFHRQIGFVSLAMILAHPILLFVSNTDYLDLLRVWEAPWRARFAVAATVLLLVLIGLSVWRKQLRLSYEWWQLTHGVLAVAVVALAVAHVWLVGYYVDGPVKRGLWVVYSGLLVGLLGWVRVVRPALRLRTPWEVVRVDPEPGRSNTLVLRPVGHPGFSFQPGQFAWLVVGGSPFRLTQHPFSFSSPADVPEGGEIAFTIKARGDFTNQISSLAPGTRVYVDGPHGVFSSDREQGAGYVLLAGGVGITPVYSMVATLTARGDVRPVWLFYANRGWDDVTFRDELADLAARHPNLLVVHVLEEPPEGWAGESGRISAEILERHLPADRRWLQCFVCGPGPMMDAMEDLLPRVGIAPEHIHTERFDMV
jgi:predicted ferric reductase